MAAKERFFFLGEGAAIIGIIASVLVEVRRGTLKKDGRADSDHGEVWELIYIQRGRDRVR
jgi:hypothetical protein